MAQFAVIGLGKFGITIAETLVQKGADVIAIDNDEKKVDEVKTFVANAICLDSTDEQALRAVNISNVDAVVLGIGGNKEVSILTAAILRKIGIGKIIAKVDSELHSRILKIMGVQRTIFPEQYVGKEIANLLTSQHIFTYMEVSKDHTLVEITIPPFFIGKSLKELEVRNKYNVGIVAIKTSRPIVDEDGNNILKEETNVIPSANDIFNEGDKILVIGKRTDVDKLIKLSESTVK
ncbi:MAG: TrkA family potassium uptake protein [Candidatus Cloacimonetes bacterium]|nr:TrkA family potassium uptake protein [Candidatus Cloacimonadota bacterium]